MRVFCLFLALCLICLAQGESKLKGNAKIKKSKLKDMKAVNKEFDDSATDELVHKLMDSDAEYKDETTQTELEEVEVDDTEALNNVLRKVKQLTWKIDTLQDMVFKQQTYIKHQDILISEQAHRIGELEQVGFYLICVILNSPLTHCMYNNIFRNPSLS